MVHRPPRSVGPPSPTAASHGEQAAPERRRVPLPDLLAILARTGATSFGGGGSGPLFRELVHRCRWVTAEEFVEGQTLGRLLPGPTLLNMLVYTVTVLRGPLAALLGMVVYAVPGAVLTLVLSVFMFGLERPPVVQGAFRGVAAAIVGLLVANAVQQFRATRKGRAGVLLTATAFVAHGMLGIDIIPALVVLGAVSVAVNQAGR